jgi:heterotetrameric sarcosine oxidase delta subunit
MRIKCPYCGERGNEEFTYRGDATVQRPGGEPPKTYEEVKWKAWMDYVYLRGNPFGVHRELWHHASGCHAWLVVTRDVRNHAILAIESAEDFSTLRRASAEVKS